MKNRVISIILCFGLILSFSYNFAPRAKAVVPPAALGAAVAFSFLWSTGIELWRDGAGTGETPEQSLENAIYSLWSDFRSDEGSGNYMALENFSGSVSFDRFGRAIITNTLALQLNDFKKWLVEKFELNANTDSSLTEDSSSGSSNVFYAYLPQNELSGLTELNGGAWAMPAVGGPGSYLTSEPPTGNYNYEYSFSSTVIMFRVGDNSNFYTCSLSPYEYTKRTIKKSDGEESSQRTRSSSTNSISGVSRPNDGTAFRYHYNVLSDEYIFPSPPGNGLNGGNQAQVANEICYILLAGDRVGEGNKLFAKLGNTVLDNLYDTLDGQAMAIDIGLTGTEEDIEGIYVGSAGEAFVTQEDAALGYSAVATPVPVEGVSELYPTVEDVVTDVEGLDVPSIGHALSTRFPFCIPFDINYLFKSLSASPKRPVFDVDVIPQSLKNKIGITQDTSFTVDFGDQKYSLIIKLVRWGTLFGFILWLALMTKRMIWTTGG